MSSQLASTCSNIIYWPNTWMQWIYLWCVFESRSATTTNTGHSLSGPGGHERAPQQLTSPDIFPGYVRLNAIRSLPWVIALNAASKLLFFLEVFLFLLPLSSPPTSVALGAWTGFHWLPGCSSDWMGMMYLGGDEGVGAAHCIPNGHTQESRA